MSKLTVAVLQFSCSWDLPRNLAEAERHVRSAAAAGARLILLPEPHTSASSRTTPTSHWPSPTTTARCCSASPAWRRS